MLDIEMKLKFSLGNRLGEFHGLSRLTGGVAREAVFRFLRLAAVLAR